MNENKLTFIDENGQEVPCTVLFTFESEEFGKNYVIFYADTDEEEVELMAASYTLNEDGTVKELQEIENDDEWELIEEVLEEFDNECDCEDCDCEDCDCEDCDHEDCDDEECECHCGCHHHHE